MRTLLLALTTCAAVACSGPAPASSATTPATVGAWRDDLASWKPGRPVPDFPLTDAGGRAFHLHDLDTPLLVSFIYTRCPVATMCPLVVTRLEEAHARGMNTLAVTLDPANDTPAVLADYARAHGASFTFATGDKEVVDAFASLENVVLVNGAHAVKAALLDDDYVAHEWNLDASARQ